MHFAFACFLAVALATKNAKGQVAPPAGAAPPGGMPPAPDEFKGSNACQGNIAACFKQLAKSLEPGEPFKVPDCSPCKECLARKLSTVKAYGSCARIIGKIPDGKNVSEEIMYYNNTMGFESLHIDCTDCEANFGGMKQKGCMKMIWKLIRLHVLVKKEPWYCAKAAILKTDLVGGKPDSSNIEMTCTGEEGWITACKNTHKAGGFDGICMAASTALFPTASNKCFQDTEGDGDNALGNLLNCHTPDHVDSSEECFDEHGELIKG